MANLINNNFNYLKLKLNNDEYWDFFVCKDSISSYDLGSNQYDENGCLISHIDITKEECIDGNDWIVGLPQKTWDSANNTPFILKNIGYFGYDNGLFVDELNDFYYKETFENKAENNSLRLHRVSGSTDRYEYPLSIENGAIKLNGGFYQGFFETSCDQHAILPSKIEREWNLEFIIKKSELEKENIKPILNDKYPNNKGMFFYIGTRAENKLHYQYDDSEWENPVALVEIKKKFDFENIVETVEDEEENIEEENTEIIRDYFNSISSNNYLYRKYNSIQYNEELILDWENEVNIIFELTEPNDIDDDEGFVYNDSLTLEEFFIVDENEQFVFGNTSNLSNDDDIVEADLTSKELFENIISDEEYDTIEPVVINWEYQERNVIVEDLIPMTDNGFVLNIAHQYKFYTNNPFLLYHRGSDGIDVFTDINDITIEYRGEKHVQENLFLLMNRTCSGYDVTTIDDYYKERPIEYNFYDDLYNNALGFRITDDGRIGYRYYALECSATTKCALIEAYSKENLIKNDEWCAINVKICKISDKLMKLYFYVNGKLKFISNDLPLLDLRKLNDLDEKQEGVPFNISLGGGTQGLIETILPNYFIYHKNRVYPLEQMFAGSFIGYIKSFKFYNCELPYTTILRNAKEGIKKAVII